MIQTYLPLYRKYRPQSFAGLVGQDAIRQTLTNAIAMDRVAHAYLFCGPRGTGKTSTARIFAKSLNCEQGPTAEPCQVCASCVGIASGQALDVIEFDAASHNGVQDARDLIETCRFAPMAGRYKIYIIDEVHMLSSQAFNALLKTLEEPPERVVFIFATTEAHKVLPTIVSRCQRFDFTRIPQPALEKHLLSVASQEAITLQADATALIARSAKGGLRDALSLLDQVSVMFQGQTVTAEMIRGLMGGVGPDTLLQLVQAITQQDVASLLALLEQVEKDGVEPARLVSSLTEHIRDLMLFSQAPSVIHPDVAASGRYAEQTPWFEPEHYPQWLQRLSQLDRQLKQTNQPQLWLEVALVELAHRQTLLTLNDLASRLERLEAAMQQGGGGSPLPMQTSAPAKPSSPPRQPQPALSAVPVTPAVAGPPIDKADPTTVSAAPRVSPPASRHDAPTMPTGVAAATSPGGAAQTTQGDFSLIWQAITDRVPSPATRGLLKQQAFLKTLSETDVIIGCSSEAILKTLQAMDKQIHLKQAVKTHFGSERDIQLIIEKPGKPTGSAMTAPAAMVASTALPPQQPVQPVPVASSSAADMPMALPVDDMPPPFDAPMDAGLDTVEPEALSPAGPAAYASPTDLPPTTEPDLEASKAYAVQLLQAQPLD